MKHSVTNPPQGHTLQFLDGHNVCEGVLGPLAPDPGTRELPRSQVAPVDLPKAPPAQRVHLKHLGGVKGQEQEKSIVN